jgi:hypothetical protein
MHYLVLLLLTLSSSSAVIADSAAVADSLQCKPAPGALTPELSFTIFVWNAWDADRCEAQIELAREMGFTALTWVPTYGWDQKAQKIIPNPAMVDATRRCLAFAWDQGLQVHFKPHFEDFECWKDPSRSGTGACWRAWLKHQPGLESDRWGYFLQPLLNQWSTRRKLGMQAELKLLLGAEMERSLAQEASSWLRMVRRLKKDWQITINSNPNWQPFCSVPEKQCKSLKSFLFETEGFQPSIYGDFFNQSVLQKIENLVDEWADRVNCSKTPREKNENRLILMSKLSVGEVGIGPSLIESEEWIFDRMEAIFHSGYPYSTLSEYLDLRKGVYTQWLTWARERKNGGIFNIWSGAQDPVGFSSGGIVDPRLIYLFRAYTQERCGPKVKFQKSVEEVVAISNQLFPDLESRRNRFASIQGPKTPRFPPIDGQSNESRKRNRMDQFCR